MPLSLNGTTLITGSQIGTGAIGTSNIAAAAIDNSKLASSGFDASKFSSGRLPKAIDQTNHFLAELGWTPGYNNNYSNMPYNLRIMNLEPTAVPTMGSAAHGSGNWSRLLFVQVKNNGENPYFSWHVLHAQSKVSHNGNFFEYASLELISPRTSISSQVDRFTVTLDGITYQLHLAATAADTSPGNTTAFMPKLYLSAGGYRTYTRVIVYDWLDFYKAFAFNTDF